MEITVAEYLASQGRSADWQYALEFARIAAKTYRRIYGREPRKTYELVNDRFHWVTVYRGSERHVLDTAWFVCPRSTDAAPRRRAVVSLDHALNVSNDAMRWTPDARH